MYIGTMNLTVRIPDRMATRITEAGGDLERRALEALALEECRADRITKDAPGDAFGFAVLNEIDGFLKAHGVFDPYTLGELDREVQALERFGF